MTRTIVITGASAGIGAALARQLGRQGHQLVLAARRRPELERVAAECGTAAEIVVADVRRRADVERVRDAALRRFVHVDVWVNNAGRGIVRAVLDLSDDDVDEMMAVNVKSALYGMQAIVPHFQERGQGHLINVSSFLGRVPFVAFRSAYNAAKHALNALTANLRMSLRNSHPGIHVSLVMPAVVRTEFAVNALGAPVPAGGPPGAAPPSQTAEEVAAVIAELIEHPVAEVYTNPASAEMARRYYQDVGAFEAQTSGASPRAGGPS
jgi:short-subunit dehydrogenase